MSFARKLRKKDKKVGTVTFEILRRRGTMVDGILYTSPEERARKIAAYERDNNCKVIENS